MWVDGTGSTLGALRPVAQVTRRGIRPSTRRKISWAGSGPQYLAPRTSAGASRSHCRNVGKSIHGDCREPARTASAPLHRSGPDREGCGPLGQGGAAVVGALRTGGLDGLRDLFDRDHAEQDIAHDDGSPTSMNHSSGSRARQEPAGCTATATRRWRPCRRGPAGAPSIPVPLASVGRGQAARRCSSSVIA
jgi:hypothetical protein